MAGGLSKPNGSNRWLSQLAGLAEIIFAFFLALLLCRCVYVCDAVQPGLDNPLRGLNDTLPLERREAEPYQTVMDGVRMLSMMDL